MCWHVAYVRKGRNVRCDCARANNMHAWDAREAIALRIFTRNYVYVGLGLNSEDVRSHVISYGHLRSEYVRTFVLAHCGDRADARTHNIQT